MIHSYVNDEVLKIHLPGDETNPSIWHIKPMQGVLQSKLNAQRELLAKLSVQFRDPTDIESADQKAERKHEEIVQTVATFVVAVENVWMAGKVHQKLLGKKLPEFFRGVPVLQVEQLMQIAADDIQLQALSFRDQPDSPPTSQAEGDRGAGGKGST